MGSATPVQTDFTVQTHTAYKAAIDADVRVASRVAFAFAAHAQTSPNMTVRLDAGAILIGTTLSEIAAQSTGTITAPGSNSRIDRVVVDAVTGAVSVITGTPGASPAVPALTAGKIPVAQVLLTSASTTITNSMVTDERVISAFISTLTNPAYTDQTLTDAANIDWNMDLGGIGTVTLGGNRTFNAPTKLKKGVYILHVFQDATGSRTATWNAVFKWQSAVAPPLSTGANKHDIMSFVCDGTNLYGSFMLDVR